MDVLTNMSAMHYDTKNKYDSLYKNSISLICFLLTIAPCILLLKIDITIYMGCPKHTFQNIAQFTVSTGYFS